MRRPANAKLFCQGLCLKDFNNNLIFNSFILRFIRKNAIDFVRVWRVVDCACCQLTARIFNALIILPFHRCAKLISQRG